MNSIKEIRSRRSLRRNRTRCQHLPLQQAVEARVCFTHPPGVISRFVHLGGILLKMPVESVRKVWRDKTLCLGLEVVTPTGEIIRTGAARVKNVTGLI